MRRKPVDLQVRATDGGARTHLRASCVRKLVVYELFHPPVLLLREAASSIHGHNNLLRTHLAPVTRADRLGWGDAQSDPQPSTAGGHGGGRGGGCGGLEQSWDTLSYFSRNQRGNIHSPVKPSRGDIDSIPEDQSPLKVFSTTTTSAAPASPNNW